MAFNPRKHLTEEQINEIVDPISLAIGAGAAGLVGYGLHKLSSRKQRKAAEAAAEKQAGEAYETGRGRGEAAGRAEGMLSGIEAGKELRAREEYLRRAHERAGTRASVAQYFGDPEIIKDARDHYRKLQTGWHTILSTVQPPGADYVNAPHTFHMAVDKIKLDKDQRTSDDTARELAALAGGRVEDNNIKGHGEIIKFIRSEGRRVGDQGLDALTRTLVHHKHHGNEDVMRMARTLISHIANRTEERYSRGSGGHEFHSTREVSYHPDLPHHTNSTHEAENLRHTILRDLFAGTYKPDERVFDVATSRGTYIDHAKHGKILDIKSVSRDRRAFEVDRAARPEIAGERWAGAGEKISMGDPVNLWGSAVGFHGKPVNSNAGQEFQTLIVRTAKERNEYLKQQQRERERLEREAAQAAKQAEKKAAQTTPSVPKIGTADAVAVTPSSPLGVVDAQDLAALLKQMDITGDGKVDQKDLAAADLTGDGKVDQSDLAVLLGNMTGQQTPAAPKRGRGRPKKPTAEGDKPKVDKPKGKRGRPKKLKEAMDFYTWMIDRQMKSRPKINEEMTMNQAEDLFKLAHRGLTPKQVEATHRAEHYLEKKGVEAKRVKGGFKFDGKRKPL